MSYRPDTCRKRGCPLAVKTASRWRCIPFRGFAARVACPLVVRTETLERLTRDYELVAEMVDEESRRSASRQLHRSMLPPEPSHGRMGIWDAVPIGAAG